MRRPTLLAATLVAVAACGGSASPGPNAVPAQESAPAPRAAVAPAQSAPSLDDACRGARLELEVVEETCAIDGEPDPAPPGEGLAVEFAPPPLGVPSGGTGVVEVGFRNVSEQPLALVLGPTPCERFGVQILDASGERVDIEEEAGGLGLCGTVRAVGVELEPGGVLTTRIEVSARAQRWVEHPDDHGNAVLQLEPAGPIPPGEYTLRVITPLYTAPERGWENRMTLDIPFHITAADAGSGA